MSGGLGQIGLEQLQGFGQLQTGGIPTEVPFAAPKAPTAPYDPNRALPPNYQEARNAFQRQLDAQNAQNPLGNFRAAVIGNDQFGQSFGYASDANAFNQFYNQNYGNFQVPPKMSQGLPPTYEEYQARLDGKMTHDVKPWQQGQYAGMDAKTAYETYARSPEAQPTPIGSPFSGIPGSFPGGLSEQLPPGYRPIELPRIREDYTNPINFLPSDPITPGTPDDKASQIDATIRPFLTEGLRQAQEIFLRQQPQMFPGQTYIPPSEQTLQALQQQENIARQPSPFLGAAQGAYMQSLGGLSGTAAGQYLNANPYQQQMMAAATRPLTQAFSEQVLPGISSLYSKSGRLGSGSMERALGTVSEQYGRSLGDITANIAGTQYQQERGLQQQSALQLANLAQAAPQIYGQQFIPSQQLAQIGAQREAIAAQPLQEQMSRFAYQQRLPYEQLSGYLSSVYGSPLGQFGTPAAQPTYQNRTAGALGGGIAGGLGGYALGSMLPSSFLGGYGGAAGGALGALGGGLLGGGFF